MALLNLFLFSRYCSLFVRSSVVFGMAWYDVKLMAHTLPSSPLQYVETWEVRSAAFRSVSWYYYPIMQLFHYDTQYQPILRECRLPWWPAAQCCCQLEARCSTARKPHRKKINRVLKVIGPTWDWERWSVKFTPATVTGKCCKRNQTTIVPVVVTGKAVCYDQNLNSP